MSKRPPNGTNTVERRSNLTSKNNKWKEQLVQGVDQKARKEQLKVKDREQEKLRLDSKVQFKNESKALDIEYGFVSAGAPPTTGITPEWKKQKLFIRAVFPAPTICRKFQDHIVFKNRECMQSYQHRVVTEEEWQDNLALLVGMRQLFEQLELGAATTEFQYETSTNISVPHTSVEKETREEIEEGLSFVGSTESDMSDECECEVKRTTGTTTVYHQADATS